MTPIHQLDTRGEKEVLVPSHIRTQTRRENRAVTVAKEHGHG
jgi:hypothetical protein